MSDRLEFRKWWYRDGRGFLKIEGTFWSSLRLWGFAWNTGDEWPRTLGVYAWPLMLWVSLRLSRDRYDGTKRDTHAHVGLTSELPLSVAWRADPWCYPPAYGWNFYKCLTDVVLGRAVYREDPTPQLFSGALVHMPEGAYLAHGKISRDSWKRPRWFRHTISRAHVDMDQPVPHPGKGENSWDCGEDGVYGMTCPASSIREAMDKIAESAMQSRQKYGSGYAWRPASTRIDP